MRDLMTVVVAIALYILPGISYLHGIYLAFQESFPSFVLALVLVPWGMIKGFFGFFG